MAPIIFPQMPQVAQPVNANPQGINVNVRIRRVAVIIMNYGRELGAALKVACDALIYFKFSVLIISARIAIAFPAGYMLTAFSISLATIYTLAVIGSFVDNRRRQAQIANQQALAQAQALAQQAVIFPGPQGIFVHPPIFGWQPQNVGLENAGVANARLNINHLQIPDVQIDMSEVPATIQVRKLLELFDNANYGTDLGADTADWRLLGWRLPSSQKGLNFNNPNEAGYINLARERDANGLALSKYQLRSGLEKLVTHIEQRKAYVGTPPAGTPQLQQFYTTLENFIRFSIYRRLKEIEQLIERPKNKPPQGQSQEVFKKYDMALQDFTRMTIDLGVLGGACAARWMSGARFVYSNVAGASQGSLEERVKALLARERETIAQAVIAQAQGANAGVDTHFVAAFYAALGTKLGLVGSQGVIEHLLPLSQAQQRHLSGGFFNRYTPNCIREVIQKAYKLGDDPQQQSTEFRELVLDWFKEQVGDWKRLEYRAKLEEVIAAIDELKENPEPIAPIPLVPLQVVIQKLKATGSIIERNNQIVIRQNGAEVICETFEDFLTEAFTREEIRKVAEANLQGKMPPVVLRNQWKQNLTNKHSLQEDLYKYVKDSIAQDARPSEAALNQKWRDIKEKSQIIGVFQEAEIGVSDVSTNLLKAFREGTDNLRGLLESTIEQDRKSEYLKELLEEQDQVENNEIRPLKEELLNKFLIGHHIFNF